ncbi:Glu S.griseus protease inhibitor, partial [Bienertia sinuspersici]
GKQTWPELVGKDGEYAKDVVEKENPGVKGVIRNVKGYHAPDFFCTRVIILVNDAGIVVQAPVIG